MENMKLFDENSTLLKDALELFIGTSEKNVNIPELSIELLSLVDITQKNPFSTLDNLFLECTNIDAINKYKEFRKQSIKTCSNIALYLMESLK